MPDGPTLTLRAWFEQFLRSLPVSVPVGESAPADPRDFPSPVQSFASAASFRDRRGARLDPESVALHQRVVRYLEANPAARYADAIRAVSR